MNFSAKTENFLYFSHFYLEKRNIIYMIVGYAGLKLFTHIPLITLLFFWRWEILFYDWTFILFTFFFLEAWKNMRKKFYRGWHWFLTELSNIFPKTLCRIRLQNDSLHYLMRKNNGRLMKFNLIWKIWLEKGKIYHRICWNMPDV